MHGFQNLKPVYPADSDGFDHFQVQPLELFQIIFPSLFRLFFGGQAHTSARWEPGLLAVLFSGRYQAAGNIRQEIRQFATIDFALVQLI